MSTEKDKQQEKIKNNQTKHVPKDAQVIMSIMKEVGIEEYEPRVINQLLEFTYRYITCVLDDAKANANHARKKTIDIDDVNLAIGMLHDKSFTQPPPRHVLSKLAETRNSMPLPPVKPHCGLRLPPDRYCLSGCNYKLRAANIPKKMTKSTVDGRVLNRTPKVPSFTGVKRQNVVIPKTQVVTIPKPVIKFSTTSKSGGVKKETEQKVSDPKVMEVDEAPSTSSAAAAVVAIAPVLSLKREREEDDFEMVPEKRTNM